MTNELPFPLAVVCHDAGAANLIIPWLRQMEGEIRPVMAGPALKIWKAAFPGRPVYGDLEFAMRGAVALLSGSGWGSTVEHEARVIAARLGMLSIAVVDHWVNYETRFVKNGVRQLPAEIWVTDEEALRIAQDTFRGLPVRCQPNLYLKDQLSRIAPPPSNRNVLYLLEPVRDDWGRGVPGEFQALDYAIIQIGRLGLGEMPRLILRPHPSEHEEKYARYVAQHSFVSFDRSVDLAAAISSAGVVVGVESFGLYVALMSGRPVYSSLPPWAPALRLPHQNILQIRNLAQ